MNAANPFDTRMSETRQGLTAALGAYLIWGMFPLYFKTLDGIPSQEVIVHRVLWSALFSAGL